MFMTVSERGKKVANGQHTFTQTLIDHLQLSEQTQ